MFIVVTDSSGIAHIVDFSLKNKNYILFCGIRINSLKLNTFSIDHSFHNGCPKCLQMISQIQTIDHSSDIRISKSLSNQRLISTAKKPQIYRDDLLDKIKIIMSRKLYMRKLKSKWARKK